MYAIVETGGKQYRVKPGDTVAVEKLAGEPGEILDLDRVLLIAGNSESETRVGSPGVAGAVVRAEVLAHFRGNKIIIFRYKSKVRYRRKTGHRQSLTRLRITDILVDGASSLREPYEASEPEPTPGAEVAEAPTPTAITDPKSESTTSAEVHEATEPTAITTPQPETVGKVVAREAAPAETPAAVDEAEAATPDENHEAKASTT